MAFVRIQTFFPPTHHETTDIWTCILSGQWSIPFSCRAWTWSSRSRKKHNFWCYIQQNFINWTAGISRKVNSLIHAHQSLNHLFKNTWLKESCLLLQPKEMTSMEEQPTSSFPGKIGFPCRSSAKMQPTDHISTAGPYLVVPSSNSGGLFQLELLR